MLIRELLERVRKQRGLCLGFESPHKGCSGLAGLEADVRKCALSSSILPMTSAESNDHLHFFMEAQSEGKRGSGPSPRSHKQARGEAWI